MIRIFTSIALLAICFIIGCSKKSDNFAPTTSSTVSSSVTYGTHHSTTRYSATGYSQSIPIDTANRMIQSYLISVHYSTQDTALRSMMFDADTLRAYLQDPSIVTVKFMLAHQPAYTSGSTNSQYSGLNPNALTMIVVGLNDNGNYVLNSQHGVYDHLAMCPNICAGVRTDIIQ